MVCPKLHGLTASFLHVRILLRLHRYLPPEFFQIAGHGGMGTPRITSAVDVFSCGVIYFRTWKYSNEVK